jgi:hypothetical protein
MMILTISILYYKCLFFYILSQSLQSLTLTEPIMQASLERMKYSPYTQ